MNVTAVDGGIGLVWMRGRCAVWKWGRGGTRGEPILFTL